LTIAAALFAFTGLNCDETLQIEIAFSQQTGIRHALNWSHSDFCRTESHDC